MNWEVTENPHSDVPYCALCWLTPSAKHPTSYLALCEPVFGGYDRWARNISWFGYKLTSKEYFDAYETRRNKK